MKKSLIILMVIGCCMAVISCKKVASEPPRSDGEGLAKKFVVPEPKPVTADQRAIVTAAKEEYEKALAAIGN